MAAKSQVWASLNLEGVGGGGGQRVQMTDALTNSMYERLIIINIISIQFLMKKKPFLSS